MTDDDLKALAIGQAFMAKRKAQRIRNAIYRTPSSTDEERQAAHKAEQEAYDRWLEARDSV